MGSLAAGVCTCDSEACGAYIPREWKFSERGVLLCEVVRDGCLRKGVWVIGRRGDLRDGEWMGGDGCEGLKLWKCVVGMFADVCLEGRLYCCDTSAAGEWSCLVRDWIAVAREGR